MSQSPLVVDSVFLHVARHRDQYPDAAYTLWRLKKVAADWDQEPDDITDEEAFQILKEKTWISLQTLSEEPSRDITPLVDFTRLTGLVLVGNQISDITALVGLTSLECLYLRQNQIKDLSPLQGMSALELLEIQDNPVADLSALAHLGALKELEMSGDQVSSFAGVDCLPSLCTLKITGECEDLGALPNLPNLRELTVRDCSSLEGIERFKELRNLNCSFGKLQDISPLAGLAKLTHLHIGGNQIESLEPLARLFALRDLWAGSNRIRSAEPLFGLPVLHRAVLKDNPLPAHEVEALQESLTSWDTEFADPHPVAQPNLAMEIVDQKTWDYYDTYPFNAGGFDGDRDMLGSEKSWLMDQIEEALLVDWKKDEDFTIPWQSAPRRSNTVCLHTNEAAESLRSIATAIQRVLCSAKNEFIIYLQTDFTVDDKLAYTIWVYRDHLLITPETEKVVTALLAR